MALLSVNRLITFATIGYTLLLATVCLIPAPHIEQAPVWSDKVFHGLAYFVFTLLWFCYLYFVVFHEVGKAKIILIATLIALLYGIVIEVIQGSMTTYRSADVQDMYANSLGVAVAVTAILLFWPKAKRLKSKF